MAKGYNWSETKDCNNPNKSKANSSRYNHTRNPSKLNNPSWQKQDNSSILNNYN